MDKSNLQMEKDNEYATCIATYGEDNVALQKEVLDLRRLADVIDLALKKRRYVEEING